MARHKGAASSDGTRAFRTRATHQGRLPVEHFREAPGGLIVSSLGLGTYLGRPDTATDLLVEAAVKVAVESGRVNVIDTAINYRHQRAERSVGRALHALIESGRTRRNEVFVATKVGYLAPDGESSLSPREWIERELLEPGILDPREIVEGSHAMSPDFLEDQLERSRQNLGLETIDLVYLHNAPDAQLPAIGRDRFMERLRRAFVRLEELRGRERLGAYGLATWDSLRARPDAPEFFSLRDAVALAEEVGGASHGFRFVQFPLNLALPQAVTFSNQPTDGGRETLLSAARRLGLGTFTSVPLLQGELARTGPHFGSLSRAASAIQWARSAPGNLAPLLGLKRPEHLSEGLGVAAILPWNEKEFGAKVPRSG